MDTYGYGGQNIRELAIVHTNAFTRSQFNLAMVGAVEKFADITPPRARLFGRVDQDIRTVARIIPRDKYPFEIKAVRSENPGNIHFELQRQDTASKTAYHLTITNLKREAGRYYDTLIIETDSAIMPEIKYFVIGIISNP